MQHESSCFLNYDQLYGSDVLRRQAIEPTSHYADKNDHFENFTLILKYPFINIKGTNGKI